MATAAIPRPRPASALPRLGKSLTRRVAAMVKPAKPVLANLASIPLHVAGLGCIDAAAFTGNTIAGLVVTGLSLIWLEHVIADEP